MGTIHGTLDLPERKEKYKIIDRDIVEAADVCIIGSGAAGAVLAKELVESGKKVVLLEKGGYFEENDMNQRELDMMPLLWKNAGFNFDDDMRIAIAQGSCLGGSTIINDAVCFDTPNRVRKEWNNLGATFTDEEWEKHLETVNKTLHVTEVAGHEMNRNNSMLLIGSKRLGFREATKNHRNCVNCMQCGFCHLGCNYGTKQNVLVTYLHEALKSDSLNVYCNCDVSTIVHKDGHVEGVEGTFTNSRGEKTFRIRVNSRVTIISAGTMASSALLLRNGIAQKTAGNGISLHPAPFVLGDFDIDIKGNEGIPMAFTVHDFGVTRQSETTRNEYNFAGGEFLIEGIFLPLLQFSLALQTDPLLHERLLQRYNNYAMAGILVRDDNNGRLTLSPTGATSFAYSLGKKELEIVAKGIELLTKMWLRLGANQVITSHKDKLIIKDESELDDLKKLVLTKPDNLLLGSAHPQSGNKIGKDPGSSVVDPDCKVHDFDNLFVCDASVFPTSVGVNPQVTVMAVASIIAQRMASQWKKYAKLPISKDLGNTCSITQPMYCMMEDLSSFFDADTKFSADMLVNSQKEELDETNWSFDPQTLQITNNLYWKGFFPRNSDLMNQLTTLAGGFWKRFRNDNGGVKGITHPFEVGVFAKNEAQNVTLDGFGKAILLNYTEPGYNNFHDVLKFVDKNTIIGKAFAGTPKKGREMMTFSMARKYPLEFMSEDDHAMLYGKMEKPTLQSMVGIWEGYLISDSTWTPPVFRFRFYFDDKTLKNSYVFGGMLGGTAVLSEKGDYVEMRDEIDVFHDEIRQVNNDILIGKYYSDSNPLFDVIPSDILFLHSDRSKHRAYLPYILKRVG